jgi:hypothetical protein
VTNHPVTNLVTIPKTTPKTTKVWDLKDAGLQAASRIAQARDPLALMQEIAQGFPSLVSSLTRQPVPPELRADVTANQRLVSPGANVLLLNGLPVEVGNFELYGETCVVCVGDCCCFCCCFCCCCCCCWVPFLKNPNMP